MKKDIQTLIKENGITFSEKTILGDWLVSFSVGKNGREIKRRMSGKTLREAIEKVRQFKAYWNHEKYEKT